MKQALVILLLAFSVVRCHADALDSIIAETHSTDPGTRIDGFAALKPFLSQNPIDPRATAAAVALLSLEASQSSAADYDGDYCFDLIDSVASLNDPASITVLVTVIGTGNRAPKQLAQFGSQAVNPVIVRASDSDWIVRKCVMITLLNMLSLSSATDPKSLAKINRTLSGGVLDVSPYVSESALAGLQLLPTTGNPEDVNGDGVVNCMDLDLIKVSFGKQTGQVGFNPRADVNRDGIVNVSDLNLVAVQIPSGTTCN